jgi:hypothetical protein
MFALNFCCNLSQDDQKLFKVYFSNFRTYLFENQLNFALIYYFIDLSVFCKLQERINPNQIALFFLRQFRENAFKLRNMHF